MKIYFTVNVVIFVAELVRRHAGVLGLGACVLSSPYDVPTWMPQLLMNLSAHLNDPQPIEVCSIWSRERAVIAISSVLYE